MVSLNQGLKNKVVETIDQYESTFIDISHKIHNRPEVGNEEFFASHTLIELVKEHGFEVVRNIAGYDTGFIATYNTGKPGATIAFLAEYDALPGLGHACGHNIIGTTSAAAAIGLRQVIDDVGGVIKVYGTPAEEGGINGSAKASYVKEGLFEGVDVALMVHPGADSYMTIPTLAVDIFDVEFFGKPAHASENPHDGINALDAMLLFFNGINAHRQQMIDTDRVHGVILNGGDAANIIPDYTRARFFTRSRTRRTLNPLTAHVKKMAEGAALQTGATMSFTFIQNGVDDFYINEALDHVYQEIAISLGDEFREDDYGFGATDTGNVSQVVPTIHPHIKIGSSMLICHTEEFCEAAASKKGDQALILGAKSLALTALAVSTSTELLQEIKHVHKKNIEDKEFIDWSI